MWATFFGHVIAFWSYSDTAGVGCSLSEGILVLRLNCLNTVRVSHSYTGLKRVHCNTYIHYKSQFYQRWRRRDLSTNIDDVTWSTPSCDAMSSWNKHLSASQRQPRRQRGRLRRRRAANYKRDPPTRRPRSAYADVCDTQDSTHISLQIWPDCDEGSSEEVSSRNM